MFKSLRAFALFGCASFLIAGDLGAITTKYPIVLAHGLLGFDRIVGADSYWNGIPKALRERGLVVYVTAVSKLDATEVRGAQLAEQIEEILKKSGAEKVNIIGHSHGGLDARYVAGKHPEWVASITTVATPHQGAALADKIIGNGGVISMSATLALNAFGKILALLSKDPNPQDSRASLSSFTRANARKFNELYPLGLPEVYCGQGPAEDKGIRFYSWTGIKVRTNWLDPTDLALTITALSYDQPNDGLVEQCSAHFGKVIRDDFLHNHVDVINGLWGKVGKDDQDPVDIYIEHTVRLRDDGV